MHNNGNAFFEILPYGAVCIFYCRSDYFYIACFFSLCIRYERINKNPINHLLVSFLFAELLKFGNRVLNGLGGGCFSVFFNLCLVLFAVG